jgi:hypothetical protein
MEFQTVLKMAAYWDIEPPLSWAYVALHFKQDEKKQKKATNVIPGTTSATPWGKLPERIRKDIIRDYVKLNPGKTEADFHKDRESKVKQRYAKRLEEARKAKAK